jgi:hypothetical protein
MRIIRNLSIASIDAHGKLPLAVLKRLAPTPPSIGTALRRMNACGKALVSLGRSDFGIVKELAMRFQHQRMTAQAIRSPAPPMG